MKKKNVFFEGKRLKALLSGLFVVLLLSGSVWAGQLIISSDGISFNSGLSDVRYDNTLNGLMWSNSSFFESIQIPYEQTSLPVYFFNSHLTSGNMEICLQ